MDARVAIVGAGPIGIEMGVALKRAGVSYLQFDGRQVGFTVSWFAPGTHFFSSNERIAIAGVPLQTSDQGKATREEYLAYLRSVVMQFGLEVRTYEQVCGIEKIAGGFSVATKDNRGFNRYDVEKIVLATGGTAKPRMLGVKGEELCHVSHYFQEPHIYFGKKLLIVGGKNSAVEAAIRCHNVGARVTLVHRGEKLPEKSVKYWLLPEITGLLESGKIAGHFNSRVVEILENRVVIEKAARSPHPGPLPDYRAREKDQSGERFEVEADFVLLLVGYEAEMRLFREAGVELIGEEQRPVFEEGTMETNVKGIFVAGTATAGTQSGFKVFIENSHVHVERILAAILGKRAETHEVVYARPES